MKTIKVRKGHKRIKRHGTVLRAKRHRIIYYVYIRKAISCVRLISDLGKDSRTRLVIGLFDNSGIIYMKKIFLFLLYVFYILYK